MNCPNCAAEMESLTLEAHLSAPVAIDLCAHCQAFWFDRYESLKLAPGSTLKLMKLIGERTQGPAQFPQKLHCPRCSGLLLPTQDMQRSTRFSYLRCPKEHGRFIRFFEFLKEKNFIRALSREEIEELRTRIQMVNCSNCGAPIDLNNSTVCEHCRSPLSMLDMKQPERMLNELKKATEAKPIDPTLPLEMARAKREVEAMFGPHEHEDEWWGAASSTGLVHVGLRAVARWLSE